MEILILIFVVMLAAAIIAFVGHKMGVWDTLRQMIRPSKKKKESVTDLQEAETLASGEDIGAVTPGVARDPYSLVLGYYINQKIAAKVRRNPEVNGQLVVTTPHLPTLIFGPPGSGKTTSLLQPSILTFGQGKSPILAGSVKHDLAQATIKLRSQLGEAYIFDPTGQTPANLRKYVTKWTPLASCRTWRGANETAASMVFASDSSTSGDSFWSTQSVSLLSVLLFITASKPGTSMQDVSKLLGELLMSSSSSQDGDEELGMADPKGFAQLQVDVASAISAREAELAQVQNDMAAGRVNAAAATRRIRDLEFRIDEFHAAQETLLPLRSTADVAPATIGGVLASATNVLQVYRYARDYARVKWDSPDIIDIDFFLSGPNTVYLCAPPRNQELYAPLLSAFATSVINRAYEIGQAREDGHLPNGLLLAIDELAAMPINDMPTLFTTGRSYHISFCVATQSMAQMVSKYTQAGAETLASAADTLVLLPKIKDTTTLDFASKVAGEVRIKETSTTHGTSKSSSKGDGGKQEGTSESTTDSWVFRPLLPPGKITTFARNEAFAIVGNQRSQLLLRPYYETPVLKRLSEGDLTAMADENAAMQVKADIPHQPTERLADLTEPLPAEYPHDPPAAWSPPAVDDNGWATGASKRRH